MRTKSLVILLCLGAFALSESPAAAQDLCYWCPLCRLSATAEFSEADRAEMLTTLRAFRDDVLMADAQGQAYVASFYEHAAEAAWLVGTDATLRGQLLAVTTRMLPGIRAVLGGDEASLTPADLSAVDALLAAFAARGSTTMRAAVASVRTDLRDAAVPVRYGFTVDAPTRYVAPAR